MWYIICAFVWYAFGYFTCALLTVSKRSSSGSVDLKELEDRFGKDVAFVVNDMLTGEGKRWKDI